MAEHMCRQTGAVAITAYRAAGTPLSWEAPLAQSWSDAGKLYPAFGARIRGKSSAPVDHVTAGASCLLTRFGCVLGACIAYGHHTHLPDFNRPALTNLVISKAKMLEGNAIPEEASDDLTVKLMQAHGITWDDPAGRRGFIQSLKGTYRNMLALRMGFSALVDGDRSDAAAFKNSVDGTKPLWRPAPTLPAERFTRAVQRIIDKKASGTRASDNVRWARGQLLEDVREAALYPRGLFTLTAPTGSGKTLASALFAGLHAQHHRLERIVVALPFTNVTNQVADQYREFFSQMRLKKDDYFLEHHSAVDGNLGLAAENWDRAVIVTTQHQLFESLHAATPAKCRKLMQLKNSVIVVDEIQSLPADLAATTMGTLKALVNDFGASVVLMTATQPELKVLTELLKDNEVGDWRPVEIVKDPGEMFRRLTRVAPSEEPGVVDLLRDTPGLVRRHAGDGSCLLILNTKGQALEAWQALSQAGMEPLFMSTNLCNAHRRLVLQQVKKGLAAGRRVVLVSTQAVEAGWDVDFPVVLRAWAPLDSLIQAMGRGNREGRLAMGKFVVFMPTAAGGEISVYPGQDYAKRAEITRALVGKLGCRFNDPSFFRKYSQEHLRLTRLNPYYTARAQALKDAHDACSPKGVADAYKLIAEDTVPVFVPYDEKAVGLIGELGRRGLSMELSRQLAPYAVQVRRAKLEKLEQAGTLSLLPVAGVDGLQADAWVLADRSQYHDVVGLAS